MSYFPETEQMIPKSFFFSSHIITWRFTPRLTDRLHVGDASKPITASDTVRHFGASRQLTGTLFKVQLGLTMHFQGSSPNFLTQIFHFPNHWQIAETHCLRSANKDKSDIIRSDCNDSIHQSFVRFGIYRCGHPTETEPSMVDRKRKPDFLP